jgi:hypothetical protein
MAITEMKDYAGTDRRKPLGAAALPQQYHRGSLKGSPMT